MLADGAKAHRVVVEGARANGIADATLQRARERLRIIPFQARGKTGKRGSTGWLWRLPGGASESDAQPLGDDQVNPEPPATGEKGAQKQAIFARQSDDHKSGDHSDDQVNPGRSEDSGMTAQEVMDRARECGVMLAVIGGKLKASPPGVLPPT